MSKRNSDCISQLEEELEEGEIIVNHKKQKLEEGEIGYDIDYQSPYVESLYSEFDKRQDERKYLNFEDVTNFIIRSQLDGFSAFIDDPKIKNANIIGKVLKKNEFAIIRSPKYENQLLVCLSNYTFHLHYEPMLKKSSQDILSFVSYGGVQQHFKIFRKFNNVNNESSVADYLPNGDILDYLKHLGFVPSNLKKKSPPNMNDNNINNNNIYQSPPKNPQQQPQQPNTPKKYPHTPTPAEIAAKFTSASFIQKRLNFYKKD